MSNGPLLMGEPTRRYVAPEPQFHCSPFPYPMFANRALTYHTTYTLFWPGSSNQMPVFVARAETIAAVSVGVKSVKQLP